MKGNPDIAFAPPTVYRYLKWYLFLEESIVFH